MFSSVSRLCWQSLQHPSPKPGSPRRYKKSEGLLMAGLMWGEPDTCTATSCSFARQAKQTAMGALPVTVVRIKTYGQLRLTLKGQINRTTQFVVLFFEGNSQELPDLLCTLPLSVNLTQLISALRCCGGFFHWSRPPARGDWLRDGRAHPSNCTLWCPCN